MPWWGFSDTAEPANLGHLDTHLPIAARLGSLLTAVGRGGLMFIASSWAQRVVNPFTLAIAGLASPAHRLVLGASSGDRARPAGSSPGKTAAMSRVWPRRPGPAPDQTDPGEGA
jgi:hypothetical protein